jgi:hypothetical protein
MSTLPDYAQISSLCVRFLVRHCPPWRWLREINARMHNPEPPRVARYLMSSCGTWDMATGMRVDAYRCGARVVVVRGAHGAHGAP